MEMPLTKISNYLLFSKANDSSQSSSSSSSWPHLMCFSTLSLKHFLHQVPTPKPSPGLALFGLRLALPSYKSVNAGMSPGLSPQVSPPFNLTLLPQRSHALLGGKSHSHTDDSQVSMSGLLLSHKLQIPQTSCLLHSPSVK